MTADTVNGSENGARSGAQALTLLAAPLNVAILRGLAQGARGQTELLRLAGSPAQSTLRAQLKRLIATGAVEKQRRNRFPGMLEYELTPSGQDLLAVVDVLESWLAHAPDAPLELGAGEAKAAIKALADGWSATIVRAISAGPRTLTELDRIIGSLNYPALERRLSAMRLAGLLVARPGNGRGTPYAVTEWLRRGIAPLIAAVRWERRHALRTTAPVGRIDAESAFLLAVPLLHLPPGLNGACRMGVEVSRGGDSRFAGAVIGVTDGRVSSCVTASQGNADAWALGSVGAWLSAVIDRDLDRLEVGGDCTLANSLLEQLNRAIFAVKNPATST